MFGINLSSTTIPADRIFINIMADDKKKLKYPPEEIIKKYHDLINKGVRYKLRSFPNLNNSFDADDIEQLVYLKIINGCLETFREDISLDNYIVNIIITSVILDYSNKKKRFREDLFIEVSESYKDDSGELSPNTVTPVQDDHSDQIIDKIEYNQIMKIVEREVSLLPPKKRDIYLKFYIEGKTQIEIGKELSITQSTVSEHLSNINKELHSEIIKEMPWLKDKKEVPYVRN